MTTSPRIPLVALCVAAIALTGCSGNDKDDKAGEQQSKASAAPSVTAPPLPKLPTFKDKQPAGAVADVKIVDCPTGKGEQTAKLELKNSTKKARDYSIMVIWLKNGDGQPRGAAVVTQKAAAPGKAVNLTAKAKVVDEADRCALNVLAGTLK